MQIHHDELSDVRRYIEEHKHLKLEDFEAAFRNYLRHVQSYVKIGSESRVLEVGTGPGWFPIMCSLKGIRCKGLEISPQLIEYAKELGRAYNVEPDIELGNIEEVRLEPSHYDVVIASCVFEHVERWEEGVAKLYGALKPGGALYFVSTNKFSIFKSGEYDFPLYGWLPNAWRYKLRIARQGPDIMKLGIDFHQFRYPLLRKHFRRIGFSKIYDKVDLYVADPARPDGWRKSIAQLCRQIPPLRHLALTFTDATMFVCVK